MWCGGCANLTQSGYGFCPLCRESLSAMATTSRRGICSSIPADIDAVSLFRYEHFLRKVVLRAKVANDQAALRSLCDLVSTHAVSIAMAREADVIVPAPSSLWGRMRGRFDLAQAVAMALSRVSGTPIGMMGPSSYMLKAKRAGENSMATGSYLGHYLRKIPVFLDRYVGSPAFSGHILLVDDVLTTGFTMKTLTAQILDSGGASVQGLVLASAWTPPKVKRRRHSRVFRNREDESGSQ